MNPGAVLQSAFRILWLGQGLIVIGVVFVMLLATLRPTAPHTASAEVDTLASPALPASPAPRALAEVYFVCSDGEAAWIRDVRVPQVTFYTVIAGITPPELIETLRTRASRGQVEIVREDDCG